MVSREALEAMLAEGCSLEEIGRRVDRHPSTVSYWLRKYGLQPVGRSVHAPRGAIPKGVLEPLIARGLSIREIGAELDRSAATVRHWLAKHGLKTQPAEARGALRDGVCWIHGPITLVARPDGPRRCQKCRSAAVTKRRRKLKMILVAEAGGACRLCGYDRCVAALEFHHVDPATKRFAIGISVMRSLDALRAEASKCVLLCSNCHAEVEAGTATLP